MTQFEKIKAMTIEELADFLEGSYGNILVGHALNWLKEEVTDDRKESEVYKTDMVEDLF